MLVRADSADDLAVEDGHRGELGEVGRDEGFGRGVDEGDSGLDAVVLVLAPDAVRAARGLPEGFAEAARDSGEMLGCRDARLLLARLLERGARGDPLGVAVLERIGAAFRAPSGRAEVLANRHAALRMRWCGRTKERDGARLRRGSRSPGRSLRACGRVARLVRIYLLERLRQLSS